MSLRQDVAIHELHQGPTATTLRDWRMADIVTAKDLQAVSDVINRTLGHVSSPRQVSFPAPPVSLVAVRIHRAIETDADANAQADPKVAEAFAMSGPFLMCFELDDQGSPPGIPPGQEFRPFKTVLPTFNQTVAQFKAPAGGQIFDGLTEGQPAYSAADFGEVTRLLQGWGQFWTEPPDQADLCQ